MLKCFDVQKLKYMLVFYLLILVFDFVIRVHDNYEILHFKYSEAKDKVESDCGSHFKSAEFNKLCKEAMEYISMSRLSRSFIMAGKQIGFCGKNKCMDFIFGPETYLGSSGVITVVISILLLWVGFNIGKIFKRKRQNYIAKNQIPFMIPYTNMEPKTIGNLPQTNSIVDITHQHEKGN